MKKNKLFFFSHFPPPLHGFSGVNQFIYDKLSARDFNVVKFSFIKRSRSPVQFYLNRVAKSIKASFLILKNRRSARNATFYMPVSGGMGMIFEIFPWLLAGIFFKKRIMHHHSFQYCYRRNALMAIMQRAQSKNIHNIFLCQNHLDAFKKYYSFNEANIYIIGNEFTLLESFQAIKPGNKSARDQPLKIGHMSNLSMEKGCGIFFELVDQMAHLPGVCFELAGPADQPEISKNIERLKTKYPDTFNYTGAVYGEAKSVWFDSLDFFIFPSIYKNEAYPLVVLEAIAAGVIPFSTPIGCLSEINETQFVYPAKTFVTTAKEKIIHSINDRGFFSELKQELMKLKARIAQNASRDTELMINLLRDN